MSKVEPKKYLFTEIRQYEFWAHDMEEAQQKAEDPTYLRMLEPDLVETNLEEILGGLDDQEADTLEALEG